MSEKVVIMAGGKGSRIASVRSDVPKPMIEVGGKPVLEHIILCAKKQGSTDFIISIGHLGEVIRSYFGDGSRWGVHIQYCSETRPLGSGGALSLMNEHLKDDFLLLNGDIMIDADFRRVIDFHRKHQALVTLFTHPNSHPYDSGLVIADGDGRVTGWLTKEDKRGFCENRVNAGIHVMSPDVIRNLEENAVYDLDRDILRPLIASGRVFAYDSPEYVKDMGTPDRYAQVCNDFETGRIGRKNLIKKQKAVFLDRDGTLNVYKGFITRAEDIELLPGVAEAIRKINGSDYLAIVITNQPVVARSECTFEELRRIHAALETLLGAEGAYLDGIYFCPHHPDKGFPGEVPGLKIDCDCRKPKPGLFLKAAKDFNIDLSASYMVGDGLRDVEAAHNAGCRAVYIGSDPLPEGVQAECFHDLAGFVNKLIK